MILHPIGTVINGWRLQRTRIIRLCAQCGRRIVTHPGSMTPSAAWYRKQPAHRGGDLYRCQSCGPPSAE